jgi:hypothetical protein
MLVMTSQGDQAFRHKGLTRGLIADRDSRGAAARVVEPPSVPSPDGSLSCAG